MGYPPDQPYPEHQSREFFTPTYQPDYSSYCPSYPNHPYQTCLPKTGDYYPTWSNEDWQIQNTPYYPDQTCPDQPQYQPHPQQRFKPNSEELHHANSAEGELEGVTVLQQNVQGGTRSEAEMIMKMQHTYEEQQSNMGEMIRQVALLSVMIKEMQENRAEPEVYGGNEEEEGVIVTTEGELAYNKQETTAEKESVVTSLADQGPQEFQEVTHNETTREEEKIVLCEVEHNHALCYLQGEEACNPDRGAEEPSVEKEGGDAPADKEPPRIDKSTKCHRDKGKPPEPSVRPKEKKKIQGTYKNHKKR